MPHVREAMVDANVLLRYLTDEPRALADRAAGILEATDTGRTVLVTLVDSPAGFNRG